MSLANRAYANERREDRADVHHRTMASFGQESRPILIVNISPNGLMARCEGAEIGERLTVRLPGLSPVTATVRWALGGRIGCELDHTIPPATYFALLPRLGG